MARKRKDSASAPGQKGFGSGLGDALLAKGLVAERASPPRVAPAKAPTLAALLRKCPDVRLQIEEKGRRGKTVTLISGLESLASNERESIARDVGRALGCGARAEGEGVVVQGDQRVRLEAWLAEN